MNTAAAARPSRIALIMGLVFALFGGFGIVGSWAAYRLDSGIAAEGERATGHLTRKSLLRAADGDSDFVIDYWFVLPDGRRVEAHRSLSKALWSGLREGQDFTVRYSAANPKRNFPEGGGVTSVGVAVFVSILSALLALFGALLLVGYFRSLAAGRSSARR